MFDSIVSGLLKNSGQKQLGKFAIAQCLASLDRLNFEK
jgi:hypothetical protein